MINPLGVRNFSKCPFHLLKPHFLSRALMNVFFCFFSISRLNFGRFSAVLPPLMVHVLIQIAGRSTDTIEEVLQQRICFKQSYKVEGPGTHAPSQESRRGIQNKRSKPRKKGWREGNDYPQISRTLFWQCSKDLPFVHAIRAPAFSDSS